MKTILVLLTASIVLTTIIFANSQMEKAQSKTNADVEFRLLTDEREIINVVNSIGIEADRRNWDAVQNAFAPEVLLDYSSMGAKIETLKPPQIVAGWKTVLPGFKATQHAISNHRVSVKNNEASSFSYVTALHYLPNESKNDVWRVVGFYEHHLIKTPNGWLVDKMKFTATIIDGNLDLPKLATENVRKEQQK